MTDRVEEQAGDVKEERYEPTKTVDVIEYWHGRAITAEQEAERLKGALKGALELAERERMGMGQSYDEFRASFDVYRAALAHDPEERRND